MKNEENEKSYLHPARRVQGIKPSSVFQLLQKAEVLKKRGRDIVSLSIGEPEWDTFDSIKSAGIKAIQDGYTKYTPAAGREDLRHLLSQQAAKDLGIPLRPENVTISAGCKYALFSVFQCFCDPGDEMILPAPYWVSYPNIVELCETKCKIVPTDEASGFKITAHQLEKVLTDKTKVFLLNSPNNPTSAVYSAEELKALGEVLKSHPHVLLVTDDIYNRIVFEGELAPHILNLCPFLKNRTFAINGGSKSYLMTGWRIAWIVGPEHGIKLLTSFQSQTISCAHSISQKALEDSLPASEEYLIKFREKLRGLRDHFFDQVNQIPGLKPYPSEGGFYLWVNMKDLIGRKFNNEPITSSLSLMEKLLEEADLLCLSGESFGMGGYLRFNYAVKPESLNKAAKRLSQFVSKLT